MTDELDILLARYFDGSASETDVVAIERLLASDPAAASAMLQVSRDELALHDTVAPMSHLSASAADIAIEIDQANGMKAGNTSVGAIAGSLGAAARSQGLNPAVASIDEDGSSRRRLRISSWQPWAAAACVLIAVGVAWFVIHAGGAHPPQAAGPVTPPPSNQAVATVESVGPESGVYIERNGVALPVAAGTPLTRNDRLHTGPAVGASFVYAAEQTRVTLSPSSVISIVNEPSGKKLDLSAGVVDCQVEKQQPGKSLVIATAQAKVKVVGTAFRVTAAGKVTRVEVIHGVVLVTRSADQATVQVSQGEFVDVGGDASTRPAAGSGLPLAQGKDMAAFWSPQARPVGINE